MQEVKWRNRVRRGSGQVEFVSNGEGMDSQRGGPMSKQQALSQPIRWMRGVEGEGIDDVFERREG